MTTEPARTVIPDHCVFRPDSFFVGPFRGWGVTVDARGRLLNRFETMGLGRLDVPARAAIVEQDITFSNGLKDRLVWEVISDDEGHFVGHEREKKLKAEGGTHHEGFRWTFRMPIPGRGSAKVCVDYWTTGEDSAVSRAVATAMGVKLSVTTTFYQRQGAAGR